MLEPGSVLAGRYKVGETLGRGGMGVVVEATHLQLGTKVAIKILRREALEDESLVERFLREARSAARLRGEHVCRVTDFGTQDDVPFMVMEHLEGEDVKTILDNKGPIDPATTATYILQACVAIAEAHSLGIIHRDIKPANLFVARRPDGRRSIKLLDFGIAKSTASFDSSLTATQRTMGSPAYMSPEQLRSSTSVDARADIWSLGVTMFEMLTEKRPFEADAPYELALTIANERPQELPDTVPPELARIVMRCLDKNPDKRYRDVAELAAALAPLAKGGRELAAAVRSALSPSISTEPRAKREGEARETVTTLQGASGALHTGALRPARSRLAIPIVLVLFVALAGGGVYVWSQGSEPAAPSGPVAAPPDEPPSPEPGGSAALAGSAAPETPSEPPQPPDAALVAEPVAVDAAVEVVPPDAAEPVAEPVKPVRKKPRGKPGNSSKDLGKSRY